MPQYGLTIQEVIDEELSRIRSETGLSAQLFQSALAIMNKALQEFNLSWPWRWARKTDSTLVTVAGTPIVSLPNDCIRLYKVNTVVDGYDTILDLLEEDQAKRLYPNDSTTGSPEGYISGVYDVSETDRPPIKTIEIKPTPDAVYNLTISYQGAIEKFGGSDLSKYLPIPQFCYPAFQLLFQLRFANFLKAQSSEIIRIQRDYLLARDEARKFDRDSSKATRAFRLPLATQKYRAVRYNQ